MLATFLHHPIAKWVVENDRQEQGGAEVCFNHMF
jgi:hypothetical protein